MQEHCREQSLFPLKSCTTSHKAILWASCFHHEAAILLSWVCSKVRGQSECVLSGLCASLKSPQCVCVYYSVCVCVCGMLFFVCAYACVCVRSNISLSISESLCRNGCHHLYFIT